MLLQAAALCFLVGSTARHQTPTTVTYVNSGADVPRLVQELSTAAGVPLFAPPAFQSDVIAVRLKDAPLDETLARIAEVTAGEWVKKDEGYELRRSVEKLRADEKAELDDQVRFLRRDIDARKKEAANLEAWTDETAKTVALKLSAAQAAMRQEAGGSEMNSWSKVEQLERTAPGGRAMTRVIAGLDPEEIAKLPENFRVVFSDRPNRLQKPLPPEAVQGLSATRAEQDLWVDAMDKYVEDTQGPYFGNAMRNRSGFVGGMGKSLLAVTKERNGGLVSISLELLMTDAKGKVIVGASANLSSLPPGYTPPPAKSGEQPIKPSPLLVALFPQGSGSNKPGRISADTMDTILNPEKHEPLGLTIGDTLVGIAESRQCNMVAAISDESFLWSSYVTSQPVTPSMFLAVVGQFAMKVDGGKGWLVLSPKLAATARVLRSDRQAMGRFIRQVHQKGRMTSDDLAQYALTFVGEMFFNVGYQLAHVILENDEEALHETDFLRFYGRLTPDQKERLGKAMPLPLADLTPPEIESLNRMIFASHPDLQFVRRSPGGNDAGFAAFHEGIQREPTEIFANGFPQGSTVVVANTSRHILAAAPLEVSPGVIYSDSSLNTTEIAQRLYAKERPGVLPWVDSQPGVESLKFRYGNERLLQFNFQFGDLALMTKGLQDTEFSEGEPVPYGQLPEAFRKEVQAKLEEMRKTYKDVKPGQYGGPKRQSPPPPLAVR